MSLNRVVCPSCQAGLKSAAGFKVGQKLRCPKCQNIFAVPDPDVIEEVDEVVDVVPAKPTKKPVAAVVDDDEDEPVPAKAATKKPGTKKPSREDDDEDEDRPRKKKKKESGGYRTSPLRFVILGGLLLVLGVLGFMLFQKNQNEGTTTTTTTTTTVNSDADSEPIEKPRPVVPKKSPPANNPAFDGLEITEAANPESTLKLQRMATAMHNYASTTVDGVSLPTQMFPTKTGGGLSWRVYMLPHLGEQALFDRFNRDEPWDSPNNKPLIELMPKAFANLDGNAKPGETYFKVFSGKDCWFAPELTRGKSKLTPRDGMNNTILLAEGGVPVIWTKPEDFAYDASQTLPDMTPPDGGNALNVAMGDARIVTLNLAKILADDKNFRAAITPGASDDFDPKKWGLDKKK